MNTRIIDISKFNVVNDWLKVKKSVDGVIIRVAFRGYGSGKITADAKFSLFAEKCNVNKIPWGIYFMSSAISTAEAEAEAVYSVEMAKRYNMPEYMPIFIDSEDVDGTSAKRRSDALSKPARTAVLKAFINKVETLGYKGGLYCSDSWTRDSLNWDDIKNEGINWLAKYGKNDGTISAVKSSPCHMHQYTSKAYIPGIAGYCDLSICYIDLKNNDVSIDKEPAQDTSGKLESADSYDARLNGFYTVTASALVIRAGAGAIKKKLGSLPKGTRVRCYGYYTSVLGTKWFLVVANGITGFVCSKYLE